MLDIPNARTLDKDRLIGGCVRLNIRIDVDRLQSEVAALPACVWGTRGGRVGVHNAAEAVFLRGFAPAEGDMPIEDRPPLASLPYVRWLIEDGVSAPPLRCLMARLPPLGTILPHVDRAAYFSKSVRLHVPINTNDEVHMVCAGLTYGMRTGEVWALNNSTVHAAWNAHRALSRTHLICDFLPNAKLLGLLATGDRDMGIQRADVEDHLLGIRETGDAVRG